MIARHCQRFLRPRLHRSFLLCLHQRQHLLDRAVHAGDGRVGDRLQRLGEDALGELEIRILGAILNGSDEVAYAVPLGWAGDRYRIIETDAGPALEWLIAFDDARHRDRFTTGIGAKLAGVRRDGYRAQLEPSEIEGRPGLRYVLAPAG